MIRCPVCRADNGQGPACRRCKADLAFLFGLEDRREVLLAQARLRLAASRWAEARAAAEEADALRRDDDSLKLVALTALMCRDFHQALRCHALLRDADRT